MSGLFELLDRLTPGQVVVFDLDDTLLSTNHRHQLILREFASEPTVRLKHPEAATTLAELPESRFKYAIVETAAAAGVTDKKLLEDLRAFWFKRFFRNEYLLADHPVPGAAEYCREVLAKEARVVYFTGRDEGMRQGTLANLERWNFPMPGSESVRLILKPHFDMNDFEYKRDGLKAIAQLGSVAGSFENEPAHLNLFQEAFPDSWLFLLETKHSGKPVEPHPSTRRIKDFIRPA